MCFVLMLAPLQPLGRKQERFTSEELVELLRKGQEYNNQPGWEKLKLSLFG